MPKQHVIHEGGVKELAVLLFPIVLVSFSQCLFLFVEKLLLARLSVEALEAAVSSSYVVMIFQAPCVALAMMAQVFVARHLGAGELKQIGPAIWQFIWFSLLSTVITIPGTLFFSEFYFQSTAINSIVKPYLYLLTAINFLFPLTAALSCFYLGRGKTKLLLWGTLAAQTTKLILAYLLIFGWKGIFPSYGLLGGALSTCIAQISFCTLLLIVFLNKKHQDAFHSFEWKLDLQKFWHYIQPGFMRASNRILNFASWSAIAHLMVSKGGDYLLVMSIGGTYFMFLPFIGDALCQAQITIVSRLLGANKHYLLDEAFNSGTKLLFFFIIIFAIPLLIFPEVLYSYLFPNVQLAKSSIISISIGIWLSFVFYSFSMLSVSYILAFKDMNFSFFMGLIGWVNGFLFMYMAIHYLFLPADQFWTVLSIAMHASTAIMYYIRMKVIQTRNIPSLA